MKLRFGESASRFTTDFDATRHSSLTPEDYFEEFQRHLTAGWSGFTGTIEQETPARPEGVPNAYIIQPSAVKLGYEGRHWLTVKFELGHDEIGGTRSAESRIALDLLELFEALGLARPEPIALLSVEHQVAQKLHACTAIDAKTGGNERAHDLVDLQILVGKEGVDLPEARVVCERLFRARRSHLWPPVVVARPGWSTLYAEASDGLGVLDNVTEAVEWANQLVATISSAPRPQLPSTEFSA
jgi:hypothetical protein